MGWMRCSQIGLTSKVPSMEHPFWKMTERWQSAKSSPVFPSTFLDTSSMAFHWSLLVTLTWETHSLCRKSAAPHSGKSATCSSPAQTRGSLLRLPQGVLVPWVTSAFQNFIYDCDQFYIWLCREEDKQEVQSRANYAEIQAFVFGKQLRCNRRGFSPCVLREIEGHTPPHTAR